MNKKLIACVLSVAFLTTPALAQMDGCMPERQWLASLETDYGEVRTYQGMSNDKPVLVTVNADTGSWTMLFMPQPGMLCILAGGEDWTNLPAQPMGEDL